RVGRRGGIEVRQGECGDLPLVRMIPVEEGEERLLALRAGVEVEGTEVPMPVHLRSGRIPDQLSQPRQRLRTAGAPDDLASACGIPPLPHPLQPCAEELLPAIPRPNSQRLQE